MHAMLDPEVKVESIENGGSDPDVAQICLENR